jgi:hypothetical protein
MIFAKKKKKTSTLIQKENVLDGYKRHPQRGMLHPVHKNLLKNTLRI